MKKEEIKNNLMQINASLENIINGSDFQTALGIAYVIKSEANKDEAELAFNEISDLKTNISMLSCSFAKIMDMILQTKVEESYCGDVHNIFNL